MKNSSEFENILDDCLERLAKGESVEQCLGSYPEQAVQLEPLLRTAQVTREALAIMPRAEFKARARYEFRSVLQVEGTKKRLPLFSLRRGWVMALMIIGILLVSGGGTALAASNSMPDSPLYPVKLATEQVQLALTPSDMGKARLCAGLADRRVAEIIYMAAKGDAQQVEVVTQRLGKRLTTLAMLVSAEEVEVTAVEGVPEVLTEEPAAAPLAPSEETEVAPVVPSEDEVGEGDEDVSIGNHNRAKLRKTVAGCACDHPDALRDALRKAPASVKSALHRAIAVSEAGYKKALKALD